MQHHSDAVVGDVEGSSQGPADSKRQSGDLHPLTLGDTLASLPAQPQASRKNRRSGLNFVCEEEGKLPTQPRASRKKRRSVIYHVFEGEVSLCGIGAASQFVSDKHWRFKRFSHAELVLATTNFSDDKKTGEGEFGSVFRGYLSDLDSTVAVKKISRGSKKRKLEFVRELLDIHKLLWHENLLELIGRSYSSGELLLVSEFMPNGSLHAHLFAKKCTLKWAIRYKIALQLASVLLYLHEECEPPLVHGDVKSSNVVLDSGFNAKLGDFGMNRLIDNEEVGSQTTMIPMTIGYLAPEYISSRRASAESDVYSFGVVALEIASGQKAFETGENPTRGLVEKIWNLYENGRLLEAADERLRMDFDTKEMVCLIIIGLWCTHPDYKLRPSMRQVIAVLQFEAEMPSLPNRMPVAMYMGSSSSAHSSQHSITTSSIPKFGWLTWFMNGYI